MLASASPPRAPARGRTTRTSAVRRGTSAFVGRGRSSVRSTTSGRRSAARDSARQLTGRSNLRLGDRRRRSGAGRPCRRPGRRAGPSRPGSDAVIVGGAHHPDRHALAAAGVDVAGVAQRHLGVRRVQRRRRARGPARAGADEDLPERPFVRSCRPCHPPIDAGSRRIRARSDRRFAPRCASAASPRSAVAPRLAHPGAVLVRLAPRARSAGVARAVARDHLARTRPSRSRRSRSARALVPAQVRVGKRQAELLGLRHGHVDEPLAQLVVGEALDPPAPSTARCAGDSSSGGPNIISDGHHQRFDARPAPSPSARGVPRDSVMQDLEALPLVEATPPCRSGSSPGRRGRRSSGRAAPGS